jgi:hypothetical protein
MGTARSRRRGRRLKPSPALLASAVLATAVLATVALSVAAGRPVAALSTATVASAESKAGSATPNPATNAKTPGWRVIAKIGPFNKQVTGTLSADSPKVAWSVWAGQGFTAVDYWNGTAWKQVAVPAALTPYVRSAVAFDGYPSDNFWLFDSYRPTEAVRYTGSKWTLQKIPSWVLRMQSGGGGYDVTASASGQFDVWVFSLGAGAYAAHYNGHAWDKMKLPETPLVVDAVASNEIWALGANEIMDWNPENGGWHTMPFPLPPPGALPAGSLSYTDLTVSYPGGVWLVGTVTASEVAKDAWFVQHWNGKTWGFYRGPTIEVGSVAPDGNGGLWIDGINVNPSGFWLIYHLSGGKWTSVPLPSGVVPQSPLALSWIRGTASLWATAQGFGAQGIKTLILKYGP